MKTFTFFLICLVSPAFASLTVTTNNQYGAVPLTPSWTPAAGSLIGGLAPSTALGNFAKEGTGNVTNLTSGGSLTIASPINYVTCGNGSGAGSNIVYTLPASPTGYNLTNISVYSGWTDNGRDAQAYTVYYATAANPTTFNSLTSVNYNPTVPGGVASANQVIIADSAGGVLVSNVVALMFDFTTPASENGYCGYGAITVQGVQSDLTVTAANQQGTSPFTPTWTPATSSLIAGLAPTTALGNFCVEGSGRNVNTLTSGGSLTIDHQLPVGDCSSNYATCGNGSGAGSNIVYTLPASLAGYNITNITVFGGWTDNGRDAQAYTVWYATAANPTNFIALTSVNYLPSNPSGQACSTCVTLADAIGEVLVSNVVALMFDFTSPPSENGYCGYAAITVQGTNANSGQVQVTANNQQGSVPFTPSWTPAADSLIAGLAPSTALGNFCVEGTGRNVNSLTLGGSLSIDHQLPVGDCSSNYVTCGNGSGAGSNIVYTLPASPTGYNITNITVYGGWTDNGRDAQAYTVWYATAANPTIFTALTSVNYTPSNLSGLACSTCVTIANSAGGVLASNVVALMFDFTSPPSENGYCGYGAITVQGTQSDLSVATGNQQGALPFTPSWTPAAGSLIAGLAPTTAGGNFSVEGSGANVNSLTAGGSLTISQVGSTCSSNYVTCGNGSGAGSNIVYTLPASWTGYNLTNIIIYGGWKDNGRDAQACTIWGANISNPTNFIPLTSVNYLPANTGNQACSTRVIIAEAAGGVLFSNIVALRFDFTSPASENGYCGYGAITAQGTVAAPIQPTVFGISESMPVVGDNVQITSNGKGGAVGVTGPQGYNQQVTVNGSGAGTWTPPRYGQYTLTAGTNSLEVWVTVIRLNVAWYYSSSWANGYYTPTNATIVENGVSPYWRQRGVRSANYVEGMYLATNFAGTNINAMDWYNQWTASGATNADGIMVDEIAPYDGYPSSQICQAMSMARSNWGSQYSLSLWLAGATTGAFTNANVLIGANILGLWEDYDYPNQNHIKYWNSARSCGLTNNSVLGLDPGDLMAAGAVSNCFAQVRLAAPEMPGIAFFNALTNVPVQAACDQAFTSYFLQPVLNLQLNVLTTNLTAWNIGNEDATNCTLQFLNSAGGVLSTTNLPLIQPNVKVTIGIPALAVTAVLTTPANMVNLYANGRITIPSAAGRYVWTGAGNRTNWSTAGNWNPSGPPSGSYSAAKYAYFDGNITNAVTVNMPAGNTAISNVTLVAGQFAANGWTLNGNPTSQYFTTYQINSSGPAQNTISIGCQTISASVPLTFSIDNPNMLVLSGQVSGSGGLVKTGLGSLTMLGLYANAYTGATVVSNGVFDIDGSWALASDFAKSSSYYVAAGATLQLHDSQGYNLRWQGNGPAITGPGTFLRTGGTYVYFANEPLGKYITFNQSAGGLADFENGQSVQMKTATSNLGGLTINNALVGTVGNVYFDALNGNGTFQNDGAGGTLNIGVNGGSGSFSGIIADGTSAQSVVKQGTGTEVFYGNNTYSGPTTASGGTLDLSQGSLYYNAGFPFVTMTIGSGATVVVGGWADGDTLGFGQVNFVSSDLVVNGGTIRYAATNASGNMDRSLTIGAQGATLDASGNTVPWTLLQEGRQSSGYGLVTSSNGLLTLTGSSPLANTFNYNLGGTGGLTKSGQGTWIVSGTNTYTGATTVSNGTLVVSGSIGSSAVTVLANGILGGTGTLGGSVILKGGAMAPGSTTTVGTLTTGSETWSNASIVFFTLSSALSTNNQSEVIASGTLTVAATNTNPITIKLVSLASSGTPGALSDFNSASNYIWPFASATSVNGFSANKFVINVSAFSNAYTGIFTMTNVGSTLAVCYVGTPGLPLMQLKHAPTNMPVSGLSVTRINTPGSPFRLIFNGSAGQAYRVFGTNDLAAPVANWPLLTNGIIEADGQVNFTDQPHNTASQWFYHVTSP